MCTRPELLSIVDTAHLPDFRAAHFGARIMSTNLPQGYNLGDFVLIICAWTFCEKRLTNEVRRPEPLPFHPDAACRRIAAHQNGKQDRTDHRKRSAAYDSRRSAAQSIIGDCGAGRSRCP